MLKHCESWERFARARELDVDLNGLIFVTGYNVTHRFAMVAFAGNKTNLRVTFKTGVPGFGMGMLSAWGSWEPSSGAHHNCGPPGTITADSAASTWPVQDRSHLNQCIFVRGCRARRRRMPLRFPFVLRAAAEPVDPMMDDRSEDGDAILSGQMQASEGKLPECNLIRYPRSNIDQRGSRKTCHLRLQAILPQGSMYFRTLNQ